ncbi:MAG: hypothetical protein KDI90_06600 [Alphaproteobacteria bacterium]|nr:hypothetical protein [Alphaproteobacteria bacterium]MCB9974938.1 hypothetical protein [Rhodospirillales bacterium]
MKNLRFLVPVFSFGLILAFAFLVPYGGGEESFISISEVYATSSKTFSAVSIKVNLGRLSFNMPKPVFELLAFFLIVGGGLFFYVCFHKIKRIALLNSQDEKNEDL